MSLFFSTVLLLHQPPAVVSDDAYAAVVTGLEDLTAYWRLGDADTATLVDASGNGHHGSYSGTPTLQAGDLTEAWQASDGVGVDFAASGHGSVAHDAAFALPQGSLTFWFEVNSLGTEQTLVGKDQLGLDNPDDQFAFHVGTDGGIRTYFQNGGSEAEMESIPGVVGVGETHHACLVWTAGGVWLWLDGRYIAKSTLHTTGLVGNDLPWRFGIRTYDDTLSDVRLDEVALYGRALFHDEIQALSQYVGGLGYQDEDALRTVNVSDATGLTNAIAAAVPGDHIVLADGTYSGNFRLANHGTRASRIVIRAANVGGATISGTGFDLDGDWAVLDGVNIAPTARCRMEGAHSRITRVTHDDRTQVIGIEIQPGAHFSRVDHCFVGETSDSQSGTRHGIRVRVNGPDPNDCPWYARVDHSLARGASTDVPIGTTPIVIGNNRNSFGACHVYKCLVDLADDSGSIELKNSGGMISHCTMTTSVYGHNRNGADCEWRSCYYRSDHNAFGRGHWIIGCTFDGSGKDLRLGPGGALQEDYYNPPLGSGAGNYPASEDVKIIGCTFLGGAQVLAGSPTFETGVDARGAAAEGCTNWAVTHDSTHYIGTINHQTTTAEPHEPAVELTLGDVGTGAPDPLVPPGWK